MASNEWLVRKLHEQDKKIEALSRGGTGVGHTSIAPGENLTVISDNGEVVLGAGGVEHVDGPTPATPSAPKLKLGFGTIETTWDGSFAEGEDEDGVPLTAPVDFDVVEVHCSTDPEEEEWGEDTMRGQIKTREGGTITVGGFDVDDEVFVCLIALAKTGKRSAPSATASLTIEGLDFSQLFNELDAANVTIKNAGEMLLEGQQTLADKLAGIADLDPEEISDEIAQARQEAIDAALAEIANVEGTLTSAIGGKSTTKWSTSNPPANYDGAVGDTWVKLTSLGSGGREIRRSRWQGDVWVDHPVDGAVLSNVDASTITTGFLDVANRIRSGSIFADKLLIGGGANLLVNPTFANNAEGWTSSPGILLGGGKDGSNAIRIAQASATSGSYLGLSESTANYRHRVTPGAEYRVSAYARSSTAVLDGRARIYVRFFTNADKAAGSYTWGTPNSISAGKTIPANEWTRVDGIVTAPEGAVEMSIGLHAVSGHPAELDWCLPSAQPAVGGTLITPGGIQTPHLAADVLEVGNLKAGTAALAEAVIKKLFAEVVVARMAQAEEFIGENALLTNSVTAPKIVASEELWAKIAQFVKIRAEHIEADAIDGMVITGGTYRTTGGTGSWSDAGLFIAQPDGTSMVRFPTDGSPLSLTASDTQIERASVGELDVAAGAIRSGGELTLASGVTPPPSPPELTTGWDMTVNLPRPSEQRMDWNGFAAWGDKWVRGVNVLGTGEGDRIEVYNADGTLNKTIPILIDPRHDLTVIGDVCYVFGKDHVVTANDVYCFAYNLTTGARVARWRFLTDAPTQQIGVTSVGSDLLTAQVSADGDTLIVRRRDASTGLVIESSPSGDAVWDLNYTNDVQGIHWDGTDLYVTHRDSTRVYTYSGSGYTRKAGSSNGTQWAGWANPNRNAGGMVFVGSTPVVVSGGVYVGSAIASDSTIEACFTWHSGGYETTPSPVLSTLVSPRETLTVSLPSRAGLSKRVYVRKGSTGAWARHDVPENQTVLILSNIQTGIYPLPTTNSFPNADPAVLRSTNGNVVVRGDGSGKWGPLTFNADGSMTSTQIPAWVPITSFGSGFGPQTFGYAPAYRVWPDGKVEWRGVVAGSMAAGPSGDYAILTIPAEARPSQPVDMISATGAGGGAHGMVRIEFTNSINPDKLMVLVRQADITWVSLDGHYYYKD